MLIPWTASTFSPRPYTWGPKFEVQEEPQEVRLLAEVPGMKTADLDVSTADHVLTIRGSRKGFGTFQKTFEISDLYDIEAIAASLEDGILTVTIPKIPKAQPRKIPITERQLMA